MRLYEYSKQHEISSKELIKKLHGAGFKVANHMSALSDEALIFLKQELKRSSSKDKAVSSTVKKEPRSISEKQSPQVKQPVKDHEEKQKQPSEREDVVSTTEVVLEPITLKDLAHKIEVPVNEVIMVLITWGIIVNKNQVLPIDIVERLAEHYQFETKQPQSKKEKIIKKEKETKEDLESRLPIVVVLGHVDHGKTSLLDYIRKTRVTAKEKGGITQHLGAYEAETNHGNIIFIDTPGHEAFSKIRKRGAQLADIAVLLVAADDSVMPQTIEAIKFAKEAELPIIVAINKVDKVGVGQIEATKRDLSQHDLLAEEWGGSTICIPISAKEGTGVDQLLEMLTLQAELMELRATKTGYAQGYVLESKVEKGRGPVATVLLQKGRMTIGDYFVCGTTSGRINSIVDSHNNKLKEVGPSNPVQVAGFDSLPEPADFFQTVPKSMRKKGLQKKVEYGVPKYVPISSINLVIKTDTLSSKEALIDSITKLSKKVKKGVGKEFNVIHADVGEISERDIDIASATGSQLLGFHVKTSPLGKRLAKKLAVTIEMFDVIYKLLERLEELAQKYKKVVFVRKKIGEAIVRRVFDIKRVGVVAGCYVQDGLISREGFIVVLRDGVKVGEGKIRSLQREKKDLKEIHSGYECAFMIEGFKDWHVDDKAECYLEVPES